MQWLFTILLAAAIIVVVRYWLKKRNLKNQVFSPQDTVDEQFNAKKVLESKELDRLLDKVSSKGIEGLSKQERERLESYSRK